MTRWIATMTVMFCAATAAAHGVDYTVHAGASRTVEISTSDGRPFAFEQYEVFGPDDERAHQIGRTDRLGRVSFVPDRVGTWRVKVFSDDGHGLTATLEIESLDNASNAEPEKGGLDRRWAAALLILVAAVGYYRIRAGRSSS